MTTKTNTKSSFLLWGGGQTSGQAAVDGPYLPPSNRIVASTNDSFTGVENRNYKAQIRQGGNATTSASGIKRSFAGTGMQYQAWGYISSVIHPTNARRSSLMYPSVAPNTVAPGLEPEDDRVLNLAKTKFAKKVEKAMTQFSGGVALGELRETLHMIRNPLKGLRSGVGDYLAKLSSKRGKLMRMTKDNRLKNVQDQYLEAAFGWLPLLGDLDDARNYLERRQEALYQEIVRVKAGAEAQWLSSDDINNVFNGIMQPASYRTRVRRQGIAVLGGGVRSKASSDKLISASAMGLSPRSFVPTLWELIPWSFAIDYFSNVGDVIQAWSSQSVSLAWGRQTYIAVKETDYYDQYCKTSLVVQRDQRTIAGNLKGTCRTFSRIPIDTPPVPGFMFEIPGMGIKWLNMAALVRYRGTLKLF